MAGILGSIGLMLAWIVIILMQAQMAQMKTRIDKLEENTR